MKEIMNLINEINGYYNKMKIAEKKAGMVKQKIVELSEKKKIEFKEIEGYIIKKNYREHYVWNDGVYQILKRFGLLNAVLKHGNEMKERFDLTPFIKPKTEEDYYVKITTKRTLEEINKEKAELEAFLKKIENDELTELVRKYASHKKIFDIRNKKYEDDKKKLKDLMIKAGLDELENFKLYEKPDEYNFDEMPSQMVEKVLIATNGRESIDLIRFSKLSKFDEIETVSILPGDLFNVNRIEKRFGAKKRNFLKERLGENFYFVEGTRIEEDVHSRFPINNLAIEALIKKGKLPEREVMRQRRIDSSKKPIEFFEIISVENYEERKKALLNISKK